MTFEVMWKREIEIIEEILEDVWKWDLMNRPTAVKIVKALFGKDDRVPPTIGKSEENGC